MSNADAKFTPEQRVKLVDNYKCPYTQAQAPSGTVGKVEAVGKSFKNKYYHYNISFTGGFGKIPSIPEWRLEAADTN